MRDNVAQLICTAVPKLYLDAVWPDVVRALEKSVGTSKGKFGMDDIYVGLQNDTYLLWLILDGDDVIAAATSRIVPYPSGQNGLAIDWLGGTRMAEWLPLLQRVMSGHAKQNNCTHLEAYGRKAWGRWLAKYGWAPEYIAYRMELSNG